MSFMIAVRASNGQIEPRDSPLVDKGEVLHLFGAVNYTF